MPLEAYTGTLPEGAVRVAALVIGQQITQVTVLPVLLIGPDQTSFPGVQLVVIDASGEVRPQPLFVANIKNTEALIEALRTALSRTANRSQADG